MSSSGTTLTSASELLGFVADPGSFEPWDEDIISSDPLHFSDHVPYAERLAEATTRSGRSESIVAGRALLHGRPLAVIAGEFAFIGGSIGVASGERVARAFDHARQARLPLVALAASGGTRMQEGSPAFVQMIKTARAVADYRDSGLPYLVYLTNPTMGGVLASWGSLGQITFAMPDALIGFSGPRVIELTGGAPVEEWVQRAENLRRHGLIDDVFPPTELRARLETLLRGLEDGSPPSSNQLEPLDEELSGPHGAWTSVKLSREANRPGARELLEMAASDITYLHGDGEGAADDPACLCVLATVSGCPAVVIAHDRSVSARRARIGPAGFRKARRGMRLAAELRVPLITIVDTLGAEHSQSSEHAGLSRQIAECLYQLTSLPVPTVAVLLGEGGGGAALAFTPADRVVAAQHAWLAPIAPEGASAIVYRSVQRASELAAAQGIASWDLKRFGIVDTIVPERPSASEEGRRFLKRLVAAIDRQLSEIRREGDGERLARRARRYRDIGLPCP